MSAQTLRSLVADQRILRALESGAKTANQIADVLRCEIWEAFSEEHGFDFEWDTSEEPVGARILARVEAEKAGIPCLFQHQIYPRLVRLEKKGLVGRIQIQGYRPILWQELVSSCSLSGETWP